HVVRTLQRADDRSLPDAFPHCRQVSSRRARRRRAALLSRLLAGQLSAVAVARLAWLAPQYSHRRPVRVSGGWGKLRQHAHVAAVRGGYRLVLEAEELVDSWVVPDAVCVEPGGGVPGSLSLWRCDTTVSAPGPGDLPAGRRRRRSVARSDGKDT